jgi:hypothetical protein
MPPRRPRAGEENGWLRLPLSLPRLLWLRLPHSLPRLLCSLFDKKSRQKGGANEAKEIFWPILNEAKGAFWPNLAKFKRERSSIMQLRERTRARNFLEDDEADKKQSRHVFVEEMLKRCFS